MTSKHHYFWILLLCNFWGSTFSFAQEPLAIWHFDTEETTKLQSIGGVHRDIAGPRPPMFPDFPPANTAVKFDGKGSRFVLKDPGNNSKFDFTNGDSITLESWVNMPQSSAGENVYILGKGRTFSPGFAKENQNWALRIRDQNGSCCASFLFFSMPSKNDKGDWHRWTTNTGFKAGSGWHHVAVSYTFGKPESITGWVDGKKIAGAWDMGGATIKPPVTDNDDIWIGSSMGGSAGNSFRGALDDVAIYRGIVPDASMQKDFVGLGPSKLLRRLIRLLRQLTLVLKVCGCKFMKVGPPLIPGLAFQKNFQNLSFLMSFLLFFFIEFHTVMMLGVFAITGKKP